jgi:hypothetical protein
MKPRPANLTPEQEEEVRRQLARGVPPEAIVATATKATRKGAKRGEMNGLETDYAIHLERRRIAGEILDWKYEALKLRIAFGEKAAWFVCDFWLLMADGSHQFHETKGWWRDAARLRIKVAAGVYQWAKFIGVKKQKRRDGGQWEFENF